MIIVSDSSCDVCSLGDVKFKSVPLEIYTDEKRFIDDSSINVESMIDYLSKYKGRSYTACPGVDKWIEAFDEEDEVYVVTMTSKLSGTYNSAQCAKGLYQEERPNAKVLVVDSLSTSSEQLLVIEKIKELKEHGKTFEEVEKEIKLYQQKTHLFFAFESLNNFAQNGRLPKILASAIGTFGITIIGTASEEGDVKPVGKARGKKKVIDIIINKMKDVDFKEGRVYVSHVENEELAKLFSDKVKELFPKANIQIRPARGLVSYYAEKGGLVVGCECL